MDEIATKVQKILQSNGYLYSYRLTASAEDGSIVVRGKVPIYYYKQMAQEVIRPIVADLSIKNLIEVVKT